jgi:hypothetical protein
VVVAVAVAVTTDDAPTRLYRADPLEFLDWNVPLQVESKSF